MKCPTCHRPVTFENNPHRPFCSERCKLLDFGAWANEEYAVPGESVQPPPEDASHPPNPSNEEADRD